MTEGGRRGPELPAWEEVAEPARALNMPWKMCLISKDSEALVRGGLRKSLGRLLAQFHQQKIKKRLVKGPLNTMKAR